MRAPPLLLSSLCLVATACGGGSPAGPDSGGDDASTPTVHGTLHAAWSIQNVDGTAARCPAGFTTMKVSALAIDAGGVAVGLEDPTIGLFDCAAGTGEVDVVISGPLSPGDFNVSEGFFAVTFEESTANGDTVTAQDVRSQMILAPRIDLTSGTGSASATFYQDGGYGWFEWSLFGTQAAAYLQSCASAGVDTVKLDLTNDDDQSVTTLTAPCDGDATVIAPGVEITDPDVVGMTIRVLKKGNYSAVYSALHGTTVIGTSVDPVSVQIDDKNKIDFVGAVNSRIDLTTI